MKLTSLSEFARELAASEEETFESRLLQDNGGRVLHLANEEELARFVAAMACMAFEPSAGDVLRGLRETLPRDCSDAQRDDHYKASEHLLGLKKLKRSKSDDSLVYDKKTRLPQTERSDARIGALLDSPYATLRAKNLHELAGSGLLKRFLTGHCTHPAKLSYDKACGGFVATHRVAPPAGTVGETDFLTVQTQTFGVASAGFQMGQPLFLPRLAFGDELLRLHELMCRTSVQDAVARAWAAQGVSGAREFVSQLGNYRSTPVNGEPQIFAGDAPALRRLSVFTPFALYPEVRRARAALTALAENERLEALDALEAAIEAAGATLQALKTRRKTLERTDPRRETLLREIEQAQKELEARKNARAALPKPSGTRSWSLLLGGANPRNLVTGLDPSVHRANVQFFIPVPRRGEAEVLRARVYAGKRAVYAPLQLAAQMPTFLRSTATDARSRRARRRWLQADALPTVAAHLLALRDAWLCRGLEPFADEALDLPEADFRKHLSDAHQAFVAGREERSAVGYQACLATLARELAAEVTQALRSAYRTQYSTHHDDEVLDTAHEFVRAQA